MLDLLSITYKVHLRCRTINSALSFLDKEERAALEEGPLRPVFLNTYVFILRLDVAQGQKYGASSENRTH